MRSRWGTTGAAVTAVVLCAVVAFTLTPPGQAVVDLAYMATTMVAITVVLVRTGSRQDTIVRTLEEGVDRFLGDRGLAVPNLVRDRGWIPQRSGAVPVDRVHMRVDLD